MDISLVISKPRKLAELYTIKGTVITDIKPTTAVNVTEKATSPFANLVNIFDVTPLVLLRLPLHQVLFLEVLK